MSLVGLLGLSYHRTCLGLKFLFVGISLVQNVFSWVFRGSKTFSWGPRFFLLVFVGQKFFHVGIFTGPNFFFMCSIVGPKFFLMYILWVHKLLSWVFRGSIVPSCLLGSEISFRGYFVGPKFYLVGISWVQTFSWGPRFFLLVFVGQTFFHVGIFTSPNFFFMCCIVSPKLFLMYILWVQKLSSWVFCGSKLFSRWCFVGSKFYGSCWGEDRGGGEIGRRH